MTEKKKNNNWGGRRKGAGRPGSNSKMYTFRAPGTLINYIDSHINKTDFFKDCIQEKMIREIPLTDEQVRLREREKLGKLGTVYPTGQIKELNLPFFDIKLVAGFPIPLDNDERAEDIELLKILCPNPEATYLIRVDGNSMIDADIHSGDIVIVDKSNRNPGPNEVAVCEFNGEYTLKHFVMENGVGWLVPANPEFPQIKVTENDQFAIWGTVTYIIHRPRS